MRQYHPEAIDALIAQMHCAIVEDPELTGLGSILVAGFKRWSRTEHPPEELPPLTPDKAYHIIKEHNTLKQAVEASGYPSTTLRRYAKQFKEAECQPESEERPLNETQPGVYRRLLEELPTQQLQQLHLQRAVSDSTTNSKPTSLPVTAPQPLSVRLSAASYRRALGTGFGKSGK